MVRAGKRRIWSDAEKRTICWQTRVAGVSVSQVARRYDANANLVFTWLRDPRFAPDEAAVEEQVAFLPVEVVAEVREVCGDISAPALTPEVGSSWICLAGTGCGWWDPTTPRRWRG